MKRKLIRIAVVLVAAFGAAQLIRPDRTNPPVDASRTIRAQAGMPSGLGDVLDRSCRDCHSNKTEWPRAAGIAPLSWLMARAVAEGRKAVNFSDWAGYSPDEQRSRLAASCLDATSGKMPGFYTWVRPEARLSARDIETICAATESVDAHAGQAR